MRAQYDAVTHLNSCCSRVWALPPRLVRPQPKASTHMGPSHNISIKSSCKDRIDGSSDGSHRRGLWVQLLQECGSRRACPYLPRART
jgi:hypothetical protein